MDTIIQVLTLSGIFIAGLIVRALVAVLFLAAVVVPISAVLVAATWTRRGVDRLTGLQRIGEVLWRRGCYYTPGHLWVRAHGEQAVRIGVDDVARRVLPAIAQVALPAEGDALARGAIIGRITSAGGTVVLRSPVAGIVAAVNHRLFRTPSLLQRDPYRRAWLVEVRPSARDYQALPIGDRAREWMAREDRRVTECFEHQLGLAAADGGALTVPPHRLLTPAQWAAVRESVFGPGAEA